MLQTYLAGVFFSPHDPSLGRVTIWQITENIFHKCTSLVSSTVRYEVKSCHTADTSTDLVGFRASRVWVRMFHNFSEMWLEIPWKTVTKPNKGISAKESIDIDPVYAKMVIITKNTALKCHVSFLLKNRTLLARRACEMFKLALICKSFRNPIITMIDVSFGTSRRNFRFSVSA